MSRFSYQNWLDIKDDYEDIYAREYFNISGFKTGVLSEGEGLNIGVYFQGCPRGCAGCRNDYERILIVRTLVERDKFFQKIKDNLFYDIGDEGYEEFMEKRWLLYLENQLIAMREFSLRSSPFPNIDFPSFVKALRLKKAALRRFLPERGITDSPDSLAHQIQADHSRQSIKHSGITFVGGEPMLQANNLIWLCKQIKAELELEIWVYSGFEFSDLKQHPETSKTLENVDYLVEGSFDVDQLNLAHPFYGSQNQRIINVQQTLAHGKTVLWEPRHTWALSYVPYWKKYKDVAEVKKFPIFKDEEEVLFYLNHTFEIKHKIKTIQDYEGLFGPIKDHFDQAILGI